MARRRSVEVAVFADDTVSSHGPEVLELGSGHRASDSGGLHSTVRSCMPTSKGHETLEVPR